MKKLWITVVSLSIFVGFEFLKADLPGQENLVPNRGAGVCWKASKDANGFEIFEFKPITERCGYFVAYQIPRDTAGSNRGWPSGLYVKIVNVDKPENAFYLGGGPFENQRPLKFGKGSKMACYGCQPKLSGITGNLPVNCSPNDGDATKRAACFTGSDALVCNQVNCSQVVDIPECYQQTVGVISSSQPNDLKLCGERDIGANYSVGANSKLAVSEAEVQVGTGFGAKGGNQGMSAQTGLMLAAPAA